MHPLSRFAGCMLAMSACSPLGAQTPPAQGAYSISPAVPLEDVPFTVRWTSVARDCSLFPMHPSLSLADDVATLQYSLNDACDVSPPPPDEVEVSIGPLPAGHFEFRVVECAGASCSVVQQFPLAVAAQAGDPPYGGTIFLDPDVIDAEDATTFTGLGFVGTGMRTMYDRRSGWVQLQAWLYQATFSDAPSVEVQVNPEFGSDEAAEVAAYYLPVIGRLPRALRTDLETVWLHKGDESFGGGNNNLLIHTGALAQSYIAEGILEETLVHEAVHTSLDWRHADATGWREAQAADRQFISTYARDYPTQEDVAESFLPWLMLRLARDRIDPSLAATIEATIPARLAYFDVQGFDLAPLGQIETVFADGFEAATHSNR